MQPESRKLLWDAVEATNRIEGFVAGTTFEDYSSNRLVRSAVERELSIVGEALPVLRRVDPDVARTIPEIDGIIGLRNVLVHDYSRVDNYIIWGLLQNRLVLLLANLRSLLDSERM
jgi:uncharacterized protein with HEPN domain